MKIIQASIFDAQGKRIKRYVASKPDDLNFRHEMFDGVRVLNFATQLKTMLDAQLTMSEEEYLLHCTYEKFGKVIQDHDIFTVRLKLRS